MWDFVSCFRGEIVECEWEYCIFCFDLGFLKIDWWRLWLNYFYRLFLKFLYVNEL